MQDIVLKILIFYYYGEITMVFKGYFSIKTEEFFPRTVIA